MAAQIFFGKPGKNSQKTAALKINGNRLIDALSGFIGLVNALLRSPANPIIR